MKLLKGLTGGKNKYLKIGGIAVGLALLLYFGPKVLKNKNGNGRMPAMPSPSVAALPPIAAPTGITPGFTPAGAFRVGISPLRQKVLA